MSKNDETKKVKNKIDGFLTKYAEKQVYGYTKVQDTTTRKVGERWVDDDGNTWEQHDGFRVKNPDSHLEGMRTTCKQCGKYADTPAQKKMLIFHQMCIDCVAEMETQLRATGKWEEYEKTKIKENIRSYIKDTEQQVQEYLANLSNSVTIVNVANEQLASVDYEKWENTKDDIEALKSAALLSMKMMHEDFEKSFGEKVHNQKMENSDDVQGDVSKSD